MLTERPLEISDILTPALNRIQEIVQSDAACIHLGSPQEQSLRLISHAGLPPEAIIGLEEIAIGESFSAWLRRPDPDNVPSAELPAGIPDPFCFPGPNALLMGKLRAAGSTLGLISCYRSDAFTPSQASILAVIGELLGVVVENHRLTRQAEKLATVHERQRLARELHDAVSQSLYSLSLFARAAKDAREVGDEAKLLDSLEQLEHNSIQALREMRLLLYQLRSIALEDGSFEQAVRARLEMVELRLGIETTLGVEPDLVLEAGLEQELFRIVTEALNNSLHYASATRVAVGLGRAGGRLVLAVEDNGVGFDPERTREGMGLQSIRERLRAFQGTFEINSHPGRGTSLRMSIPEGVCGMEGVGSNG
jgi:signal transduction histidine kinase